MSAYLGIKAIQSYIKYKKSRLTYYVEEILELIGHPVLQLHISFYLYPKRGEHICKHFQS